MLDKKKFLLFGIIAGVAGVIIGVILMVNSIMHFLH
jgi:ABC-type lipoprotein release transport system permease subunit